MLVRVYVCTVGALVAVRLLIARARGRGLALADGVSREERGSCAHPRERGGTFIGPRAKTRERWLC